VQQVLENAMRQGTGLTCDQGKADVPYIFPDERLADPQLLARGMIVELEHPLVGLLRCIGNPVHLSETPITYHLSPRPYWESAVGRGFWPRGMIPGRWRRGEQGVI
jgi:hypothetical protein